jgi:hypothetical protein
MSSRDLACPVCGGAFEDGFMLDFGYWKYQYVSRWVEGAPEMMMSGVPAFDDRRNFAIDALRCTKCGYLSLFASKEVH